MAQTFLFRPSRSSTPGTITPGHGPWQHLASKKVYPASTPLHLFFSSDTRQMIRAATLVESLSPTFVLLHVKWRRSRIVKALRPSLAFKAEMKHSKRPLNGIRSPRKRRSGMKNEVRGVCCVIAQGISSLSGDSIWRRRFLLSHLQGSNGKRTKKEKRLKSWMRFLRVTGNERMYYMRDLVKYEDVCDSVWCVFWAFPWRKEQSCILEFLKYFALAWNCDEMFHFL